MLVGMLGFGEVKCEAMREKFWKDCLTM